MTPPPAVFFFGCGRKRDDANHTADDAGGPLSRAGTGVAGRNGASPDGGGRGGPDTHHACGGVSHGAAFPEWPAQPWDWSADALPWDRGGGRPRWCCSGYCAAWRSGHCQLLWYLWPMCMVPDWAAEPV